MASPRPRPRRCGMPLPLSTSRWPGWGPAEEPALALAAEPHLVAVLDPGRDGDLEQALAGDAALAPAGGAGIPDDPSLAVALGARTGHREEALREAHLALTAAGGAGLRVAARLDTRAAAGLAGLEPRHLELGLDSLGRLLEGDLEIVAKVVAPPRAGARAPAVPAAEEALEQVLEDGPEPGFAHPASDRPEAVVLGALLRIREDAVGLADLLEAVLGLL